MEVKQLYQRLYQEFRSRSDPDTWWPIVYGRSDPPAFERVISNILVTRTKWERAIKDLERFHVNSLLTAHDLAKAPPDAIASCIRGGFHHQKASLLNHIGELVVEQFDTECKFLDRVSRRQLLQLCGMGEPTADRILLYACGSLAWPVDDYCVRVFSHFGMVATPTTETEKKKLHLPIKELVRGRLGPDRDVWQRFHALMPVEGRNIAADLVQPHTVRKEDSLKLCSYAHPGNQLETQRFPLVGS